MRESPDGVNPESGPSPAFPPGLGPLLDLAATEAQTSDDAT
jgi:hypothetical protein